MPGISRIKIASGWSDWRTKLAEDHEGVANTIYRQSFDLADGYEGIKVNKSEAISRYDWKEGIDVILETKSGTRMTLQEKFLTYHKSTITFEERKSSGAPGAWYYCTAQYYFVGYTRKYWDYKSRILRPNPVIDFQDFILVDLAAIHRADEEGLIDWQFNKNRFDNRRASFRFISFNAVPPNCIIRSMAIQEKEKDTPGRATVSKTVGCAFERAWSVRQTKKG